MHGVLRKNPSTQPREAVGANHGRGVMRESMPTRPWAEEGFPGQGRQSWLLKEERYRTAGDVQESSAGRGNWACKSGRWESVWAWRG